MSTKLTIYAIVVVLFSASVWYNFHQAKENGLLAASNKTMRATLVEMDKRAEEDAKQIDELQNILTAKDASIQRISDELKTAYDKNASYRDLIVPDDIADIWKRMYKNDGG